MAAVLLVFQYGQPGSSFAMARDGLLPQWAAKLHPKYRVPHITTLITGIFVALWSLIGDAGETYNLTNIGRCSPLPCVHRRRGPAVHGSNRPRPFRVPWVWPSRWPERSSAGRGCMGCRGRLGCASRSGWRSVWFCTVLRLPPQRLRQPNLPAAAGRRLDQSGGKLHAPTGASTGPSLRRAVAHRQPTRRAAL